MPPAEEHLWMGAPVAHIAQHYERKRLERIATINRATLRAISRKGH